MSGIVRPGGGVFVSADAVRGVAEFVEAGQRVRRGTSPPPYAVSEAIYALTTAAREAAESEKMFAPNELPRANMPGQSATVVTVTTAQLAEALGYHPVHARRLAAAAGVARFRRGTWPADAATTIRAWRRDR
jgi:hypothetical protein